MKLSELHNGHKAIITKVRGRGAFRKRIAEMGFVKGKEVTAVKYAPLKDPIEYNIMGYEVSLRKSEAYLIEVITSEEAKNLEINDFHGVITDNILKTSAKEKGKIINVALVGNPNCGKTTLFNYASKSKEHVGNYGGVTVDAKMAKLKQGGYTFNIIDLPGTYSLSTYSPEELFVRKYIFGEIPDIVVNVIDASNLERNFYLTTQLIDMDIKVIIALNMYDELIKAKRLLDYKSLGSMLGIPVIPTVSSKGKGIKKLFDKIIDVYEDKDPTVRHIHINYGQGVEGSIQKIQEKIKVNKHITDNMSSRFLSIKLLESDKNANFTLTRCDNYNDINETCKKEIKSIEEQFQEDAETVLVDARYGFIAGALKETFSGPVKRRRKATEKIDHYLTHKILGFPIFMLFMFIMFFTTFEVGTYPMNWIEKLVGLFGDLVSSLLPQGVFKDLLIDGIITGVGGVIIFLPNILILFLFISFMEDTGYMARAAFIMDKLMHKIGLHGKSFIPLIMGFGCNVPAIMATRTLENRNDRLLTMLINPFMSCSARLPVYILIIGAIFKKNQSLILFFIYIIGIVIAIIVAKIFKKVLFKSKEAPFVMELPPYRVPTIRSTIRHMWYKGAQYLKKMGGVILIASIIIWFLGYYPKNVEYSKNYDNIIKSTTETYDNEIKNYISNNDKIASLNIEKQGIIKNLEIEKQSEQQANSYIGRIGKFIEPVIKPLGFDWKIGISLLTGIAAKEVVVSTMAVLYNPEKESNEVSLKENIRNHTYTEGINKGNNVFTPLVSFGFLMFILIYFPCVAVIVAIKKESGSWKWAIFTIFYTTSLAWTVSFLVFQIGNLFN
ncbi:MAG: ferrous iron transport protein B [Bacteroidales bacterium]|nr:ferrous iron transport protein B [Bacteroidales bacterium]